MKSRSCHLMVLAVALLESRGCDGDRFGWRPRTLVYPDPRGSETKVQVLFGLGLPMEGEVSMTLGYVLKCNYRLPYNSRNDTMGYLDAPPLDIQSTVPGENKRKEKRFSGVSRWNLYKMLEGVLGKGCLLRAICEAAELPFFRPRAERQSLLGHLLHALLTPSMTNEEYDVYADRQYHAAEIRGRSQDCQQFYRDCSYSPLDYFSRIIDFSAR